MVANEYMQNDEAKGDWQDIKSEFMPTERLKYYGSKRPRLTSIAHGRLERRQTRQQRRVTDPAGRLHNWAPETTRQSIAYLLKAS